MIADRSKASSVSRVPLRRAFARKLTGARLLLRSKLFLHRLTVEARDDLVELGAHAYGSWNVPDRLLGPRSTCYLAGVGEDISFDFALIDRYGCTVHAFDPVPAAGAYALAAGRDEPRFVFYPVGLWSSDTCLGFHAPAEAGFISHSATDLHGTSVAFKADVRSVGSLMHELGHGQLDLLKISAEGSEHEIVRGMLDDAVDVSILCIEFAQPARRGTNEATLDALTSRGYRVVAATISSWSWKLTFVRA